MFKATYTCLGFMQGFSLLKASSTKEFLWLGPRPILNLSSDIVIVKLLHRVGLTKLVMALYLCLCGVAFLNFVKSDVGVVPKDMF